MRSSRLAAVLLVGAVLSGCATLTGDGSPGVTGLATGDVAARGGDAEVTVAELEDELAQAVDAGALQSEQFTGSELERRLQLQTLVLDNLFQIELATTAARQQFGIEVTADDLDALVEQAATEAGGMEALQEQLAASGQTLDLFRRSQFVATLRQQVTEALLEEEPLTEEEVIAEYEGRQDQFEQVSASHILLDTEDQAEAVLQRLEQGEDFAELAAELSQDAGSADAGGSLGQAPRGSFVAPFEEAIWSGPAEVGEVLGPVETQFGYHVIRVDGYEITPEDEAVEQIRQELEQGRGDELFGFWFRDVRSDVEPQVQGRFGRWDPVAQSIVREGTGQPSAPQQPTEQ